MFRDLLSFRRYEKTVVASWIPNKLSTIPEIVRDISYVETNDPTVNRCNGQIVSEANNADIPKEDIITKDTSSLDIDSGYLEKQRQRVAIRYKKDTIASHIKRMDKVTSMFVIYFKIYYYYFIK